MQPIPFKEVSMKNIMLTILLFGLLCSTAFAKLTVVATLPWVASIAEAIGKDKLEIVTLVKPNQDPHMIEAKPSMILAARKADILMYNGLDLEIGYLPVLMESSRNQRIQPGRLGNLDCSQFVSVIEKPAAVDRSLGDVHPLGNPHYHLSPRNIGAIADGMAKRLSELDPASTSFYTANAATFRNQLQQKLSEWQAVPLSGKRFIAYHRFFEYLASEFGFSLIGYIEAKPGIPPSAGHMQQLIDLSRQAKPHGILTTAYHGRKQTDTLSSRTGLTVIMVPHEVGSTAQATDWFSLMDAVFASLH